MKKILLYAITLIVFCSLNVVEGQAQAKRLSDYKRSSEKKEIKNSREVSKVKSKEDLSRHQLVYTAVDGSTYPISEENVLVKFKGNVTLNQMNTLIGENFELIKEEDIGAYKNVILTYIGNNNLKDLNKEIEKLNNSNQIKYAHKMYVGTDGKPFGATEGTLVKLKSSNDVTLLQNTSNQFGGNLMIDKSFPKIGLYYVEASEEDNYNSIKLAINLNKVGQFEYAEPDLLLTPTFNNTNDESLGLQWGLNNDGENTADFGGIAGIDVRAFDAWGIARGSGIKIAVIDSGVDLNHEDFSNLLPGYSLPAASAPNGDQQGDAHGTACAGIVGATGDNNLGVAGVAYEVSIIPVNSSGSNAISDIIEMWTWVFDEAGADITSNSYSYGSSFEGLEDILEYGLENGRGGLGTINFFATGNDNSVISWPASSDLDAVIAVGAMSMCGERKNPSSCDGESWGSNFGPEIDLVAPSPRIFTTDISGSAGYDSGDYTPTFNGTSAATPFAAGVAGLVLSANPTLSGSELRVILEESCSKFGDYDYQEGVSGHPNGSWHEEVGYGMINAFQAASVADVGPRVYINSASQSVTGVEADGCLPFKDHTFEVRSGEYTGNDAVVTVNVVGGTAEQGVDFEFIGGNSVTFTGGTAQSQTITIRTFSDNIDDAGETIDFELSIDAGDTNLELFSDEDFTSTTWTINDATAPDETAEVGYTDDFDPVTTSCLSTTDLELEINVDGTDIFGIVLWYSEEISWDIRDENDNVVSSGSNYPTGIQVINETVTLPDTTGEYTFTMYDSVGDGLSGFLGPEGDYELRTSEGVVVASGGGDYGFQEATGFCLNLDGTVSGVLPLNASVYEAEDCDFDYVQYDLGISITACVSAEEDVTATVIVNSTSTAMEGEDYMFPEGKEVVFNGEGQQVLSVPIRFLSDDLSEGPETIDLSLEVDKPSLVNLSELSTQTITIFDNDVPSVHFATNESIRESDYNCTDVSNTLLIPVNLNNQCEGMVSDVTINLVYDQENSTATLGEDLDLNETSYTVTEDNFDEPFAFEVTVYNDYIVEGDESMVFSFTIDNESVINAENTSLTSTLKDAYGNQVPEEFEDIIADFENGADGWTFVSNNDVNSFILGNQHGLGTGQAAYVSNNPSTGAHAYSSTDDLTFALMVSPVFSPTDSMPLDFLLQVEAEPGFDFATIGIVDASSGLDLSDFNSIAPNALIWNPTIMTEEEDPIQFQELFEGFDFREVVDETFPDSELLHLLIVWRNDSSIANNPPIAVDNIMFDNVTSYVGIETDVMESEEIPSYPIKESTRTFFYNTMTEEIALELLSSSDHGCSAGYVDSEGAGATNLISSYVDEYRADKTFQVTTDQPDGDASLTVGLYYTISEINGWENATGNSRDDLYVFKTNSLAVNDVDSLCVDYNMIDFAKATLTSYGDGFVVEANFETGLYDITGFGISALPSFTPGEFTAVQNEEEVEITFENKYSTENIDYLIFEEFNRDLEWVELETISNVGNTNQVIDYFPYNGINRYRVAAVLNNGDKIYPCYEAEVFYEPTNDFQVSPNPASNNINLVISDGNIDGVLNMDIYDERGRMVMNQDLISYAGVTRYDVDISSLAVGQYYIRVESSDGHVRYATFIKATN